MEIRVQWAPSQPQQPVTASVAAPNHPRGMDRLLNSFNRVKQAEELRLAGKLDAAQAICEQLLREQPDYWAALHTLGLVLVDKSDNEQALNYLVRAVMLDPRSCPSLTALGGVYLALGANEMAAQTLEQARSIDPQDPNILSMLGEIYRDEREYDLARDALRAALALDDDLVKAAVGLGWVYASLGQNAEAGAVFEGLLQRGLHRLEGFVERGMAPLEVLGALANLPSTFVKIDVLSELDNLVREHGHGTATFENTAAFVRAAALDKLGRHKEAWGHALPANRAMFSTLRDELRRSRERENAVLGWLRANPIRPSGGNDWAKCPVSLFILGPSRSGKTTMERLVATLEGVKRGYENLSVDIALRRAFQSGCLLPNIYFELLPEKLHSLFREIYIEEITRRAGSAKVFTNTAPGRISDAGMVATTLPNVRFICVKRHLDDTILRIFQLKYKEGNFHAYDLKAARDHVLWYHQMIDLLAEKLPDSVRVIRYEDVVADPAAALRTAAELCGLPPPSGPVPCVGDDRGCAKPYRQFMAAALQ
jgi:tetratricopeptide (TPR) repeat protein